MKPEKSTGDELRKEPGSDAQEASDSFLRLDEATAKALWTDENTAMMNRRSLKHSKRCRVDDGIVLLVRQQQLDMGGCAQDYVIGWFQRRLL